MGYIFGIIVAAIPNTTESIVIKANADIAPAKIIKRGCRIAIIAAIKNVLSPSSNYATRRTLDEKIYFFSLVLSPHSEQTLNMYGTWKIS
uniref:Uncharacterized protein n=1 Tax=Glossina palpalis gambiensis TaxID=67801 RepID=A0A1B0C1V9_9MUSC